MKKLMRWCAAAVLLVLPGLAGAAFNCTISSGGVSLAYSPTAAGTTIVSSSFTINCTRALSDSGSVSWSVAVNNGLQPNGINNRAAFGGSFIRYDLYKDGACGTQWKGGQTISGGTSFQGGTSVSTTVTFWACLASGQNVPAGIYTDSVTMTLSYGPTPQLTVTGTIPIAISTPASCNLTSAPGNIVLNYMDFGGAVNASTTFGVTCSSFLPYTMALDATSGTLVGIAYTLGLSATSATGTGALQTFTITGSAAAGQSGTCASGSCTATAPRLLTITY